MDKYQIIDNVIVMVDAMVDLRGAEKCRCALEIINKLSELKKDVQGSDDESRRKIAILQEELRKATAPEDGEDVEEIDGKTYKIGVTGGQ